MPFSVVVERLVKTLELRGENGSVEMEPKGGMVRGGSEVNLHVLLVEL